jgi:hypothetical protein
MTNCLLTDWIGFAILSVASFGLTVLAAGMLLSELREWKDRKQT